MKYALTYDFVFSNRPQDRFKRHAIFWLGWTLFSTLLYFPVNLRSSAPRPLETLFITAVEALLFSLFSHAVFAYLLAYWLIPRFFYKRHFGLFVLGIGRETGREDKEEKE